MDRQHLTARLAEARPLLCPGVYDALSAALVEQAGFEAAYLSGASIAYTKLGAPDIGLVSLSEVADVLSCISERVQLPVIVDADTGFGNALNVQRTVRVLERAGAAAIQLEDQDFPKRCGHLRGKSLIPTAEMVGKIRAAVDARENTRIIARTDAIAVEGFEPALERAERYLKAGADVLFIEAPENREQMEEVARRFSGRVPLLANMVEGGRTPIASADELGAIGYRIVIYPGGTVRALTRGLQDYFAVLKQDGTTARFRDRMHDFDGLNAVIGTPGVLERGSRYDAEAQG
jgi:2-methylisocitrate lyase-like PEP mutase family enzyme